MRLLSARFKGLKGIYSKSGKKDIFIDFTQCKHNIVYIVGKNGSGKSTLMSVLHPFPDPPSIYLDGELGEKELSYLHDGTIYNIYIQYPLYANGTRAISKVFFKEITPQGEVELNPNGTVGSYKEALFTKFELDPNFIALSYLSTEDRGLVDKRPADRKKLVASLLESIEVYNNIYSVLAKKSKVMKTLMSGITNKINSIGDPQKLNSQLISLDQRFDQLSIEKEEMDKMIGASEATIKILDPDNTIQTSYKNLIKQLDEVNNRITILGNIDDSVNMETLSTLYMKQKELQITLNKDIEVTQSEIDKLLIDRDEDSKRIAIKNQKLNSIIDNTNISSLRKTIAEYKKSIFGYEEIFKKININGECLSSEEYKTGLEILEEFRTTVSNVKSYTAQSALDYACEFLVNNSSPASLLLTTDNTLKDMDTKIQELQSSLIRYNTLLEKTELLTTRRPAGCVIDACSFLEDAMAAMKEEPQKNIEIVSEQLEKMKQDRIELSNYYEDLKLASKTYNDLVVILRTLNLNESILSKLPIGESFTNREVLIERIRCGDTFNNIYDLYQYIEYANIFNLYRNDKDTLKNLEAEYKAYKVQESQVSDIQAELNELIQSTSGIDNKIKELNEKILEYKKQQIDTETSIAKIDGTITRLRKLEECRSEKASIESKLNVINTNIEKISIEVNTINKCRSRVSSIISELAPIKEQRERIKFQCVKLAEYNQEWNEYNQQNNIIEVLKKYSSPTKGGIQTIFMQLYMDKILNMSNNLLRMMFNGELELLPYIINENEFRIPVRNVITNMVTDDISNCSTSEKCMIAMIMSFTLAFQGSPIYNIIRLDEIDGGLDQYNRSIFPQILSNIMGILCIEQCLIVSHSSESDMADVDIISLTPVSTETIRGNVIFQL